MALRESIPFPGACRQRPTRSCHWLRGMTCAACAGSVPLRLSFVRSYFSSCRTTAHRRASLLRVPRAHNPPGQCPFWEENEMKQLTYHVLVCLLACLCLLSKLLRPVRATADVAAQVASRGWRAPSLRFKRLSRRAFQVAAAALHRSLPVGVRRQSRLWCGRHGLLCRLTPACAVI